MKFSMACALGLTACLFACSVSTKEPTKGAGTNDKQPSSSSKDPSTPTGQQGNTNQTPPDQKDKTEPAAPNLDGATVAITVDGKKMTATKIVKSDDTIDGIVRYQARVFFTPEGGKEEQIHLIAYTAATGCFSGTAGDATISVQGVEYMTNGKTFETPYDAYDCGLILTEASATKIAGSFAGQLNEAKEGPAAPVSLALQFDIPMAAPK